MNCPTGFSSHPEGYCSMLQKYSMTTKADLPSSISVEPGCLRRKIKEPPVCSCGGNRWQISAIQLIKYIHMYFKSHKLPETHHFFKEQIILSLANELPEVLWTTHPMITENLWPTQWIIHSTKHTVSVPLIAERRILSALHYFWGWSSFCFFCL